MKTFAWLAAIATLVASGGYAAVSLGRWEWNRALFFGLVFLAAEVAVAAAVVLTRLARISDRLDRLDDRRSGEVERAVRRARVDHERFPWLAERRDRSEQALMTRTNVFITMVVGGGVLLSGAAWVIDRIASATSDGAREQRLTSDLEAIDYPRGGLVLDDTSVRAGRADEPLARPVEPVLRRAAPRRGSRRTGGDTG